MDQKAIDKLTRLGVSLGELTESATCPDCQRLTKILADALILTVEVAMVELRGSRQPS